MLISTLAVVPLLLLVPPPTPSSPLADIGPAPEVSLTDASGRPFSLASLRGKAVVVSFIYTTCSGACPATTLHLTRVQKALEREGLWGRRVHFVSITLDPTRDRPETLAQYARTYEADRVAWHFLTGPPGEVSQVIADWGMWAKVGPSGVLDHPSRSFLVDPSGRQREIYNLETLTPKVVVEDVKTVLNEAARQRPIRGDSSSTLSPPRERVAAQRRGEGARRSRAERAGDAASPSPGGRAADLSRGGER